MTSRILYVSSPELVSHAASRGVTISAEEALILINNAQDYIDTAYTYRGTPVFETSEFPREGLEHYAPDEIPRPIKNATLYACMQIHIGAPIQAGMSEQEVKREVVSPSRVETEYRDNSKLEGSIGAGIQDMVRFPHITRMLSNNDLLSDNAYAVNLWGYRG